MVSNVSGRGDILPQVDPRYKENDPLIPRIDLMYPKLRGEGHLYLGIVRGNPSIFLNTLELDSSD